MDKMYTVKKRIFKLREKVENEFLSEKMNEQKLMELSVELDALILKYMKAKRISGA